MARLSALLWLSVALACETRVQLANPPQCDAFSCATGCCHDGVCLLPGQQSGAACGNSGQACATCADGVPCLNALCQVAGACSPSNCAGCCSSTGVCVPFGNQSAGSCGSSGSACQSCASPLACSGGACVTVQACGPSNCAGCCLQGTCLPLSAQSSAACGVGGQSCSPCQGGSSCSAGQCGTTSSCGACSGCCSIGFCVDGSGDTSCGANGSMCGACQNKDHCIAGRCTACTTSNCAGCCDFFGYCVAGNADTDCGSGGVSCRNCNSSFTQCVGNRCQ